MRFVQTLLWGVVLLAVFGASAYLSFNFYVRRGAMTVPELAGLTSEEASRLLSDLGLRFRAAEPAGRWNAEVEEGRIIETRPRAGGFVKRGSAVEVVLSLGVRQASVPNLAGKAMSAAQVTVQAEGLGLGGEIDWLPSRKGSGSATRSRSPVRPANQGPSSARTPLPARAFPPAPGSTCSSRSLHPPTPLSCRTWSIGATNPCAATSRGAAFASGR